MGAVMVNYRQVFGGYLAVAFIAALVSGGAVFGIARLDFKAKLSVSELGHQMALSAISAQAFIDANEKLIRTWFLQRFVHLLVMNQNNPASFYYSWANGPKRRAVEMAERVWQTVNLVNLREFIAPTKSRANVILHKTAGHEINYVYLRNY